MEKGENAGHQHFLPFQQCFQKLSFSMALKMVLQILGQKFYINTKKSSLYSQNLVIFIHKTPVVENHSTKGESRELLRHRSTPTGITVYFYMSSSLIYTLQLHRRMFQTLRLKKTLWKMITCLLSYVI